MAWPVLGVLFFCSIGGAFFVHELGHCLAAWLHGRGAVPTPMREYVLGPIPPGLQNQVSLGGILGSVVALLAAVFWLHRRPGAVRSALLAGAMTAPGFFTLRLILAGRGHDGTEFQEAQSALGFAYAGHALDWVFAALFVAAAVFWFWRTRRRLTLRLAGRLVLGAGAAFLVVCWLQSANNAVFDPLFGAAK